MRTEIPLLFVVALGPEWQFLKCRHDVKITQTKNLYTVGDAGLMVFQCGFGSKAAERMEALLHFLDPRMIVHFGCSGGLVDGLKVGDLVLPNIIVSQKGSVEPDYSALEKVSKIFSEQQIEFTKNSLFSSDVVLKNAREKIEAHKEFQSDLVDMESFAVACVCRERSVPYVALRAIFDEVADDLESIGEPYDASGDLSAAKLTVNLLKNPSLFLSLPELKRRSDRVQKSLKRAITTLITN